ncbi:MAG: radical SAM protein [Rickettsiales bacterium]|jgi:oxygen-independent coproporphyrinogen-3 oxidase|nr:radical SAM protein [Rickettsiales bacterium]
MNLYVHVPFCAKKCNYCAFYSTCPDTIDWDGYVRGLETQLDWFRASDYKIETLFFGGGTPSLMPVEYAEKIIGKLNLAPDCEWTLEANPKTLSSLELKDWKDLGLNRLSIGMQSFDNSELRFLGRIHAVSDSMDLLDAANGLDLRVSGDFIYGIPNHNVASIIKLCGQINDVGLEHASLYELTSEPGTKFQNLPPVSEQLAAEMYQAIQSALRLPRYEVSNYGNPCRHNMNVWMGKPYIGVGESASGRIIRDGKWYETKIAGGRVVENELTSRERAMEIAITGLRTMRGVEIAKVSDAADWGFIHQSPQYFLFDDRFLRMTDEGLMLLDGLIKKVL